MPRQVNDARISTRTAREKLKGTGKPYYREIGPGLHLGYRKLTTGGKWVARVYVGAGKYATETLAVADDHDNADGRRVLDFSQAQRLARQRATELLAQSEGAHVGPYTVAAAFDEYLAHLGREGRDGRTARHRIGQIKEHLGSIQVAKLKRQDIQKWIEALAATPPKFRNGDARPVDMSNHEVRRKRKDTANRALTDLKAALNLAFREGKANNDQAWRVVKPFKAVSSARVRYLSLPEVTRLLNAAPKGMRELIQGALLTGARLADLCRMRAGDFMPDAYAVTVGNRKGQHAGKTAFACYLSPEGMRFFTAHTAGREPGEAMFLDTGGQPIEPASIYRPMREINEAARLDPPTTFHALRHTYASQAVMAGVPLLVIAQNLGHSDTRMVEKHYGHLAPSFARDAIAKGLPTWGVKINDVVKPIGRRVKK